MAPHGRLRQATGRGVAGSAATAARDWRHARGRPADGEGAVQSGRDEAEPSATLASRSSSRRRIDSRPSYALQQRFYCKFLMENRFPGCWGAAGGIGGPCAGPRLFQAPRESSQGVGEAELFHDWFMDGPDRQRQTKTGES